jgi:hypothetical protein
MLTVMAPIINQIYGEEMPLLLAPSLSWAASDESVAAKSIMSSSLRKLIVDEFPGGFETNPVEKVSFIVTGNGYQLHIVDLTTQDGTPNGDGTHIFGGVVTGGPTAQGSGEDIQGLSSLLYQHQLHIEDLNRDHNECTYCTLTKVRWMNTNICHSAQHPANLRVGVDGIVDPYLILLDCTPPSLSSQLTNLFVL